MPERREVHRAVDSMVDMRIAHDDGRIVVVCTTATASPDCAIDIHARTSSAAGVGGRVAESVFWDEMRHAPPMHFAVEYPVTPPDHVTSPPATSPAARARKTLRGLLGPWRYLRFIHQGYVTTRGPSGRVWVLKKAGIHYLTCKNGHKFKVCQANTGLAECVPGEDRVAFALLYLRSGPEGERELVAKGGLFEGPRCADCAEAMGKEWPPKTESIFSNLTYQTLQWEPMAEAYRELLERAVREPMESAARASQRRIEDWFMGIGS